MIEGVIPPLNNKNKIIIDKNINNINSSEILFKRFLNFLTNE